MQCAHCATPVPDDAKFCHNCGSQVSDAEGQASATASMDASAFAHMEQLLREDTEGDFRIEKLLGRGGMAVVYLATDIHLSRKIAVKVLPPELTFGHGVERFKREAKTAAALDHPNIIPIYRISSGGKIFWYAMKYLEGRSLDDLLKERGRLPLDETVGILRQVADALDYAHEHHVVHRDMKPANVMLDDRNRVIVTDFGIAKALTEGTLTASGSVVGTPYYMSPEQGMGKPVTGRADQYSVAVMAYRMLSGQVPFEGDSAIDILHKHCMMPPPPLEVMQPGLPKYVYKAIHKALEKRPEHRFETVRKFVDALTRPTPDTDAYPDLSASDMATVVVQRGGLPQGATATPSHTPPSGEISHAPTEVIDTAKSSRVRPAKAAPPVVLAGQPKRSLSGVIVGAGLGIVVLAVGGFALFKMLGGGPRAVNQSAQGAPPPVQQAAPVQRAPAQTAPAEPPAPTTGRVIVTGLPAGGSVIADGERQTGTTFELPAGRHELVLRASGYQELRVPIDVGAGRDVTVPFVAQRLAEATRGPAVERPRETRPAPAQQAATPPAQPPAPAGAAVGTLQVIVRPAAIVSVDGQTLGERTRFSHEVTAGIPHLISFQRDGFVRVDTLVTVRAGDTVRLQIQLRQGS